MESKKITSWAGCRGLVKMYCADADTECCLQSGTLFGQNDNRKNSSMYNQAARLQTMSDRHFYPSIQVFTRLCAVKRRCLRARSFGGAAVQLPELPTSVYTSVEMGLMMLFCDL